MKKKTETLYFYIWGNNEKRSLMKDRICRIIAHGKKNSVWIEFVDNGQQEIVSRNSLRRFSQTNMDKLKE
jgi:hypothetical protein